MVETWLKEQLDAIARKMKRWPDWEKKMLADEIKKTPLRVVQSSDDKLSAPIDSIDSGQI